MDSLATIVERLCAWKDVSRSTIETKDSFFVRGQVFAYLGKKGVVVKLAPPQVTEALKILGDPGERSSRSRARHDVVASRLPARPHGCWPGLIGRRSD
jgi:hypothetical protein